MAAIGEAGTTASAISGMKALMLGSAAALTERISEPNRKQRRAAASKKRKTKSVGQDGSRT